MLIQAGTKPHKAFAIAKKIFRFENKLVQILQDNHSEAFVDLSYTELFQHYPQLKWNKLNHILKDSDHKFHFEFRLNSGTFLADLDKFLKSQNPVLIASYIMIKFQYYILQNSAKNNGQLACIEDLRDKMELGINFSIQEYIFHERLQLILTDIQSIFAALKQELEFKIRENRLEFNEAEIVFLLQKLANMNLNIGNLPENINKNFINEFYNNLEFENNNYFKNQLLALKHNLDKSLVQDHSAKYHLFFNSAFSSRSIPFYIMQKNLIIIPFGILNPPVYHESWSHSLKLSIFGTVLAHEMVHAFDTNGLFFNYAGSYSEIGRQIRENMKFQRAVNCLHCENTININERIADIVSIRLTYDALFEKTNQQVDPSQKFNFFVNFAKFYCGRKNVKFTHHDEDHIRVQQMVNNFAPFAEFFQCVPKGYNSVIRCRIF